MVCRIVRLSKCKCIGPLILEYSVLIKWVLVCFLLTRVMSWESVNTLPVMAFIHCHQQYSHFSSWTVHSVSHCRSYTPRINRTCEAQSCQWPMTPRRSVLRRIQITKVESNTTTWRNRGRQKTFAGMRQPIVWPERTDKVSFECLHLHRWHLLLRVV